MKIGVRKLWRNSCKGWALNNLQ